MKSRDYIRSRDAVGSGFMKELGEAVGRMDLDPAQRLIERYADAALFELAARYVLGETRHPPQGRAGLQR